MDDLISKQEAIDRLSEVLSSEGEFERAKEAILEAPTAYNVDKVVEQVEEITDRINNYCEEIDHNIPEDERSGYKMLTDIFKLREIVKAGGVNES